MKLGQTRGVGSVAGVVTWSVGGVLSGVGQQVAAGLPSFSCLSLGLGREAGQVVVEFE